MMFFKILLLSFLIGKCSYPVLGESIPTYNVKKQARVTDAFCSLYKTTGETDKVCAPVYLELDQLQDVTITSPDERVCTGFEVEVSAPNSLGICTVSGSGGGSSSGSTARGSVRALKSAELKSQIATFQIPMLSATTLTSSSANVPVYHNIASLTGTGIADLITQSVVGGIARVTIAAAGHVMIHWQDEIQIDSSTAGGSGREGELIWAMTQYSSDGVDKRSWVDEHTISDPITQSHKFPIEIDTGLIPVDAGDYFTLNFAFSESTANKNVVFQLPADNPALDERVEFFYYTIETQSELVGGGSGGGVSNIPTDFQSYTTRPDLTNIAIGEVIYISTGTDQGFWRVISVGGEDGGSNNVAANGIRVTFSASGDYEGASFASDLHQWNALGSIANEAGLAFTAGDAPIYRIARVVDADNALGLNYLEAMIRQDDIPVADRSLNNIYVAFYTSTPSSSTKTGATLTLTRESGTYNIQNKNYVNYEGTLRRFPVAQYIRFFKDSSLLTPFNFIPTDTIGATKSIERIVTQGGGGTGFDFNSSLADVQHSWLFPVQQSPLTASINFTTGTCPSNWGTNCWSREPNATVGSYASVAGGVPPSDVVLISESRIAYASAADRRAVNVWLGNTKYPVNFIALNGRLGSREVVYSTLKTNLPGTNWRNLRLEFSDGTFAPATTGTAEQRTANKEKLVEYLGIENFTPSQENIYPAEKEILKAGSNITITPSDSNNTLTVSSEGGGAFVALDATPTDLSNYINGQVLRVNTPAPGKWLEVKGANGGELHSFKIDIEPSPTLPARNTWLVGTDLNYGYSSFGTTYGSLFTAEGGKALSATETPIMRLQYEFEVKTLPAQGVHLSLQASITLLIRKTDLASAPSTIFIRFYSGVPSQDNEELTVELQKGPDNSMHDYHTYTEKTTGSLEDDIDAVRTFTYFNLFRSNPSSGDQVSNPLNLHESKSVVEIASPPAELPACPTGVTAPCPKYSKTCSYQWFGTDSELTALTSYSTDVCYLTETD